MRMYKPIVIAIVLSDITFIAGAAQWETLPEQAPAPADNPTTAEKVGLGKILYFDPRYSATGTVSCFSCHNVMAQRLPILDMELHRTNLFDHLLIRHTGRNHLLERSLRASLVEPSNREWFLTIHS